eukprot:1183783-Prorocentrum_minimum.AAC.2
MRSGSLTAPNVNRRTAALSLLVDCSPIAMCRSGRHEARWEHVAAVTWRVTRVVRVRAKGFPCCACACSAAASAPPRLLRAASTSTASSRIRCSGSATHTYRGGGRGKIT